MNDILQPFPEHEPVRRLSPFDFIPQTEVSRDPVRPELKTATDTQRKVVRISRDLSRRTIILVYEDASQEEREATLALLANVSMMTRRDFGSAGLEDARDARLLDQIEEYMREGGDSELFYDHIRTLLQQAGRGKGL